MHGPDDDTDLFKKPLKFLVKTSQAPDNRSAVFFLSLEWLPQATTMQKKELIVKLSDEEDPFFLYVLNLDNEAFNRLKNHQGLLVDFISFPQSVIDLLELCIQEDARPEPKYVLHLNLDTKCRSAQMEIVEVNRFKMLTHLSLKLCSLSDEQLKQYLCTSYKKIKHERDAFERSKYEIEQQYSQRLQNTRETLKFKDEELLALRKEMQSELKKRDKKHSDEIDAERQKLTKDFEDERKKISAEIKNKDHCHRREIKALESKATSAEKANEELQESVAKLDKLKQDLQIRIKSLEKESKNLTKRLDMFQHQNKGLESDLKEVQVKLEKLESESAVLQQENAAKDAELSQLRQDVDILEETKFRMEEEHKHLQNVLVETQQTENLLRSDIAKGNDIIRIMQVDAKNAHDKLKDKNMLISQLEELMKEKEKNFQKLHNTIKNLEQNKNEYESEISSLKASNDSLTNELQSLKEILAEKENIIQQNDSKKAPSPANPTKSAGTIRNLSPRTLGNNPIVKQRRTVTAQRDHGLEEKYLQRNNDLCVAALNTKGDEGPAPQHLNRVPQKPPVHPSQTAKVKRDTRAFQARFPGVTKQSTTSTLHGSGLNNIQTQKHTNAHAHNVKKMTF